MISPDVGKIILIPILQNAVCQLTDCPSDWSLRVAGRVSSQPAAKYLEDGQDAAVPDVALVRVILGVAQTSQHLQSLAAADPAALGAEHLSNAPLEPVKQSVSRKRLKNSVSAQQP